MHKISKYKKLPADAVDEIIMLMQTRHKNLNGFDMIQVMNKYFKHALKCRVIKKFDFTNKQKQLLFAAIQFLNLFLDDADKKYRDVIKLHDVLTRIGTRYQDEIEQQLSFAYKQFAKITNKEDVLCNHLILSTSMAIYFAKDASIDLKLKDKILKLSNKIHDDVEKTQSDTPMYLNSAKVCMAFYDHIERQNNKKG